jgi:hypothetical protein
MRAAQSRAHKSAWFSCITCSRPFSTQASTVRLLPKAVSLAQLIPRALMPTLIIRVMSGAWFSTLLM